MREAGRDVGRITCYPLVEPTRRPAKAEEGISESREEQCSKAVRLWPRVGAALR